MPRITVHCCTLTVLGLELSFWVQFCCCGRLHSIEIYVALAVSPSKAASPVRGGRSAMWPSLAGHSPNPNPNGNLSQNTAIHLLHLSHCYCIYHTLLLHLSHCYCMYHTATACITLLLHLDFVFDIREL